MTDVSLLAHVRRPAVTVWRARFAKRSHPFPEPIQVVNGQELFDCEQVVGWLETTGCGNNPAARDDAIAFTLTAAEVIPDNLAFAGLSALLCLRAATGHLPAEVDDVIDLAESFDSDDELLFGEIETLGARLEPLTRYAELLIAAALDPADPFDELVRRRQAAGRAKPLDERLRRLLAKAAMALADEAGFADPIMVVRGVADVDLIVEAVKQSESRGPLRAAISMTRDEGSSATARLARRWLHVHGITRVEIADEGDGHYELPEEAVALLRLPTDDLDQEASLNEVSNLCLNLSDRQRALVVGPAASLTDALRERRPPGRPPADARDLSTAGLLRSDALRTDVVRAIVRLPHGLLAEQPRARVGLWCLGPNRAGPAAVLCAEMSQTLTDLRADDLVTDLLVAMMGPQAQLRHQLTHARFRPSSDLSTTSGDLIAPTANALPVGAEQAMTELRDLLERATTSVPGVPRPVLAVRSKPEALVRRTLGEAVRQGKIALLPGARIETDRQSHGGEVPIVRRATDLQHRERLPGLSLTEIATDYPQVELTRPGDIVISTSGRPAARVDHAGGVLVAYPARILRCHRPRETSEEERAELRRLGRQTPGPQTFIPEVLAADINALPADATKWKAWPLSVLPAAQIEPVERVLDETAVRRQQLEAALANLEALVPALTRAVGAQICTVADVNGTNRASLERTLA